MTLVFKPYVALGPIRFGMRRDEVRVVVKTAVRAFRKTPNARTMVDAFDDEGIHVYYDEQDICEAVEVGSPAAPTLDGQEMIGRPFAEVRDWLQARDPEVLLDETGLTDFTIGLGLYAPSADKVPNDPVQGAIAFRRGYYD